MQRQSQHERLKPATKPYPTVMIGHAAAVHMYTYSYVQLSGSSHGNSTTRGKLEHAQTVVYICISPQQISKRGSYSLDSEHNTGVDRCKCTISSTVVLSVPPIIMLSKGWVIHYKSILSTTVTQRG